MIGRFESGSRLTTLHLHPTCFMKVLEFSAYAPRLVPLLIVPSLLPLMAAQSSDGPEFATVTFTLDFPASDPSHYSISIRQDGHGTYESSAKPGQESEDQLYESEFEVSPANREKIFALTRQCEYFSGKIDSGNRKLAFTGKKTLSYQEGQLKHSADFNYSSVPAAQQLTVLFQSMASTLDYGRLLAYSHRYQKLALDEELKRMEAQARNNELNEIGAVAPVLQDIIDDATVINVVRARAQRILQTSKGASAGR